MAYTKARREANERYNDANYDRITIRVPAGRRDLLEDMATDCSMSVNRLVNLAIAAYLNTDEAAWNDRNLPLVSYNAENARKAGFTENVVFRAPAGAVAKLQHIVNELGIPSVDIFLNRAILQASGLSESVWRNEVQQGEQIENETPQQVGNNS